MTAAVPLVERLAEALCPPHHREGFAGCITHADGTRDFTVSERRPCTLHAATARALLPVVEQAVAEARGEALREAADQATRDAENCPEGCHSGSCSRANLVTAAWLRDRADAIATTEDAP